MNPINDPYLKEAGRNDPCPCGSGKKYKKCCLLKQSDQQVFDLSYESQLRVRKNATDLFIKLAAKQEPDWEHEIYGMFMTCPKKDMEREDFYTDDEEGARFLRSMLELAYIYAGDIDCMSVWEYVYTHNQKKFSGDEAVFCNSLEKSEPGFFQVKEIFQQEGKIEVQNIYTKQKYMVIDKGLASSVVYHDIFSGIIVPWKDGLYVMEGAPPVKYTPQEKDLIINEVKEYYTFAQKHSIIKYVGTIEEFVQDNPIVIYWVALEYFYTASTRPMPHITTTDGEELIFSKSYFKVINYPALITALEKFKDHIDEEHNDGTQQYAWLNAKDTLLGHIVIEKDMLIFETNSKERLKKWKTKVKKLPLEFVRTEYIDTEEVIQQKGSPRISGADDNRPSIDDDEMQAFAQQYMKKHYDEWISVPLPALNGKTPEQAVKTAAGKKKVAEIIDSIENMSLNSIKEDPNSMQSYFDADRLRRKLGLKIT